MTEEQAKRMIELLEEIRDQLAGRVEVCGEVTVNGDVTVHDPR